MVLFELRPIAMPSSTRDETVDWVGRPGAVFLVAKGRADVRVAEQSTTCSNFRVLSFESSSAEDVDEDRWLVEQTIAAYAAPAPRVALEDYHRARPWTPCSSRARWRSEMVESPLCPDCGKPDCHVDHCREPADLSALERAVNARCIEEEQARREELVACFDESLDDEAKWDAVLKHQRASWRRRCAVEDLIEARRASEEEKRGDG